MKYSSNFFTLIFTFTLFRLYGNDRFEIFNADIIYVKYMNDSLYIICMILYLLYINIQKF